MLARPAPARRETALPIETALPTEVADPPSDFVVPLERNPWWLWELPAQPPATVPSSDDGER